MLRRINSFLAVLLLGVAMQAAAFDLQGHRGARALVPENSLASFARALEIGVTTLELDIAITKDGVLMVHHDRGLNPDITRDAKGNWISAPGPVISTLTFDELRRFDVGRIKPDTPYAKQFSEQVPIDGTRIPTLKELFDLVKKSGNATVRFAIETKLSPEAPGDTLSPEEFTKAVVAAIREAGMEKRASILSFDWRTLQVLKKIAPEIPGVYLTIQRPTMDNIRSTLPDGSPWVAGFQFSAHGSVPKMIKAAGGTWWSANFNNLDAAAVKEAHGLGIKVLAWTVNDVANIRKMMDAGVDGIVSDRPDLVREEMKARGMALPVATPIK